MKTKIEYTLMKVKEPAIHGGVLFNERGAFGIELQYSVSHYRSLVDWKWLLIFNPFPFKVEEKNYIRPLKEFWSAERGRLPKNFWGKQSHPLCGVGFWWEFKRDRGQSDDPILLEQIEDHAFIKRLREATKKSELTITFDPQRFYFITNNQKK